MYKEALKECTDGEEAFQASLTWYLGERQGWPREAAVLAALFDAVKWAKRQQETHLRRHA